MSKNEKSTLKYFSWLLGAFGTSYLAREAWIWSHMKNLKNEIVKKKKNLTFFFSGSHYRRYFWYWKRNGKNDC